MKAAVIIIIIIFILIISINVRLVIYKKLDEKINIDLYILPKLNIRIDVDKLLKKYSNKSLLEKVNLFFKDFKLVIDNKKTLKDLLKKVTVRNIKINIYYDYINYPNTYIFFTYWFLLSSIKRTADGSFKKVKKEDYCVFIKEGTNDIYMYIDLIVPIYKILLVGVKNIKIILRSLKKNESSN